MSFEEPNLSRITSNGEKVYGEKPSKEHLEKILEANRKAEAELARKLADPKPIKPVRLYGPDDLDWNQEGPEIEEELKKAA